MRHSIIGQYLVLALLVSSTAVAALSGQEPPIPPVSGASAEAPVATNSSTTVPANNQLIVPAGTRLPLVLRNGINTRTAKQGDSVYFESAYPIAANNRIAIPMGTFVRGQILEAKRPGRIRGRGEFRIAIEQMTFPNGYTIELLATPSSVDPRAGASVDSEGIKGSSSSMRDTTTVFLTTAGGAYIGAVAGAVSNGAPGRGALIGGGAGGLGALIAVLATRGPEAELPRGTMMDVVFDRPFVLDAAYLPALGGAGIDPQLRYPAVPPDGRMGQRETHKKHLGSPLLLPFLFLPLLR